MISINLRQSDYTTKNNLRYHENQINEYIDNYSTSSSGPDRECGKYAIQLDDYIVPQKVKEFIDIKENYEYCPNCERKFFLGRLKLHLKSCKTDKPLKAKKIKGNSIDILSPKIGSPSKNFENSQIFAKNDKKTAHFQEIESSLTKSTFDISQNKKDNKIKHKIFDDNVEYYPSKKEFNNPDLEPKINDSDANSDNNNNNQVEEDDDELRVACFHCNRKFDKSRINKHEKICAKGQKKRPVFDMKQKRKVNDPNNLNQNSEIKVNYVNKMMDQSQPKQKMQANKKNEENHFESLEKHSNVQIPKQEKKIMNFEEKDVQAKKRTKCLNDDEYNGDNNAIDIDGCKYGKRMPKWKIDHENLIKNVKFNKKLKAIESRGEDTTHMKAPETFNPDYVPCPYCLRKFAPKVADRHIPKCKDIFNRPKPPKNVNIEEFTQVLEKERKSVKVRQNPKNHKDNKKDTNKENIDVDAIEEYSEDDKSYYDPLKYLGSALGNREKCPQKQKKRSEILQKLAEIQQESEKSSNITNDYQQQQVFANQISHITNNKLPYKENFFLNTKTHEDEYNSKIKIIEKKSNILNSQSSKINAMNENLAHEDSSPNLLQKQKTKTLNSGLAHHSNSNTHHQPLHYENVLTRSSKYSSVMCQYCNRKFAPKPAERHIPICKNLKNRVMIKPYMRETVSEMPIPNATEDGLHAKETLGQGCQQTTAATTMSNTEEAFSPEKEIHNNKLARTNKRKQSNGLESMLENAESNQPYIAEKLLNEECNYVETVPDNMTLSSKSLSRKQLHVGKSQMLPPKQYHQKRNSGIRLTNCADNEICCNQCNQKIDKKHNFCGFCGCKQC